jgi:hypothetical protein
MTAEDWRWARTTAAVVAGVVVVDLAYFILRAITDKDSPEFVAPYLFFYAYFIFMIIRFVPVGVDPNMVAVAAAWLASLALPSLAMTAASRSWWLASRGPAEQPSPVPAPPEAGKSSVHAVRAMVAVAAVAVGLWLGWVHLVDLLAYREPYGLWRCRIANGGAIGDPGLEAHTKLLRLLLLPASFAVVKLALTGARQRGKALLYRVGLVALLIGLMSVANVYATDAMLYPNVEDEACDSY